LRWLHPSWSNPMDNAPICPYVNSIAPFSTIQHQRAHLRWVVNMANETRRKQYFGIDLVESSRPTLTSGEAASILGISRWTILRRLKDGCYTNIGRCKTRGGWIFDMEDVVRSAFPSADDDYVVELMRGFRETFMEARRRGKREAFQR
jgi:hypothetical protein